MTRRKSLLLCIGVFGPPALWFAFQQAAGGVVYFRCAAAGPPVGVVLGLASVAACLSAGWAARRGAGGAPSPTAGFLAQLAAGLALVFAFAALVTLAAIVLIPPCAR
jgi:hypothetical protein